MSQHFHLAVLPSLVDEDRVPLPQIVADVQPVFDLAESRLLLVDAGLQTPEGESITSSHREGRRTEATLHPRALVAANVAQVLLDATSRVYDWVGDTAEAPAGERRTLLIPLESDPMAPEPRPGFLVVQGRREVIHIAWRCLARAQRRET